MANQRININLSESARRDLDDLAEIRNCSYTEIVRLGLQLVDIATREISGGNRISITDAKGTILRELVLLK